MRINLQYAYTFIVILGTFVTASLMMTQEEPNHITSIVPHNFASPYGGQNDPGATGLLRTRPGIRLNEAIEAMESQKVFSFSSGSSLLREPSTLRGSSPFSHHEESRAVRLPTGLSPLTK